MTWLLIYLLAVSLYDLRTRRIPNWCTFPLIIAGMIAHFPGHMDLWFALCWFPPGQVDGWEQEMSNFGWQYFGLCLIQTSHL
jgi:hypothetical protein